MSFYSKWGCRYCGSVIFNKTAFETHAEALADCDKLEAEHSAACTIWPKKDGQPIAMSKLCACCWRREATLPSEREQGALCLPCSQGNYYPDDTTPAPQ